MGAHWGHSVDRDRNLIFGVFAVQLHKISSAQLVEVATAWVTSPSKGIPSRLLDAGYLKPLDRDFIQRLVDEAVSAYGGDAAATLSAVGGEQQIQDTFAGSIVLTDSGGVGTAPTILSANDVGPETSTGVEEAPGRYKHVSEYARGGMGRVLLVHDEHLGRDIALKELLPSLIGSDSASPTPVRGSAALLSRFLQEARITGQLEHPAIVPVYELGRRSDGALYYTMKLVRGRTLSKAIKESATLEGRLKLLPRFVDLCHAIAYAHSRGVIHRDLKPANIMVGEFGETVVLDWGLAKVKGREDAHADGLAETLRAMNVDENDLAKTAYGAALGTPAYMPPEQARGQLDQIDERSDIYSLGAVLYELLTGSPPYTGKTAHEVLYKVLEEAHEPITKSTPTAPPELVAICERALKRNPAQRYPSAREIAEEIERFQSGALVQAHAYTPAQLLSRFMRRYRPIVATAAAAILILAGVTALYVVRLNATNRQLLQSRNTESEARQKAENTVKDLERTNYVSSIRLAQANLDRNVALVRSELLATPTSLRNWEWGYLYKNFDQSLLTLTGHTNAVSSASFSADGKRIVTASQDFTARIWDADSGNELLTLTGHDQIVNSASFSVDGKRVVTASYDGTAKAWDAETGKELLTLTGHANTVISASFSADGKRIITAAWDGTAKVWDAQTGNELLTLTGHEALFYSASFNTDGTRILTASDKSAKVWDAGTGKELLTLTSSFVNSASFSANGKRVVTASMGQTAKVWDAETGEELLTLTGHAGDVNSASFSADGTRIVTASGDGTARVWDADTGNELRTLTGHTDGIVDAAFSANGEHIVTASSDQTAKVWDADLGMEPLELTDHLAPVSRASFSADATRIVKASSDRIARVWDAVSGKELLALTGHENLVYSASFSADGKRIVTASFDCTAKVWDADSGKELRTLAGHEHAVNSASFSADGKRIVTASFDSTAKVWDADSGKELRTLTGHRSPANSASFSADGNRVVTASSDKTAKVWDAVSGKELCTLTGHANVVYSASFSTDGKRIVTASRDKTAKVWNADTGKELLTLTGHTDAVYCTWFSTDGKHIVTTSWDRTAKVWDATPWDPAAWLNQDSRQELTKLALRSAPDTGEIVLNPMKEESLSALQSIESFARSLVQESANDTDDVVKQDNEGYYLDSVSTLPRILQGPLQEHDVLVSISGRRVASRNEFGKLLNEFAAARERDISSAQTLRLQTVNTYSHRLVELVFPGWVESEFHFTRANIAGLLKMAANVIRQNFDPDPARYDVTQKQNIYVGRMAGSLKLQETDQMVTFNEMTIDGYPSLLEAFNRVRDQIESGALSQVDLVVHRESTNQYIRQRIIVDP